MQKDMIFNCYGIQLRRLGQADLRQVWLWRNCPFVREKMQYQKEISWEEQQKWFESLSPTCDWYFIGFDGESPLGVFHIKAIDWLTKTGEAGAFVSSPESLGKPEVGIAILALMDFAFLHLQLKTLEAKYHPDFKSVANLNQQLGYEIFTSYDDGFVRARVTKEGYFQVAQKLRQAARTLKGDYVSLENFEPYFSELVRPAE
jgi:RimJ/RimL family protein N-acetyltransferase